MDNHKDKFTQYSNNIEECSIEECNDDMHSDSDFGSVDILDDAEEKGRDTNEVGVCETPVLDGETTEACKWLFNVLLQAMEGKESETVFTDQAQAIAAAISEMLPNSNHRLCLWHIFQNAAKRLSPVFNEFKTFSKDFKKCVYHPETVEEFESNWQALLDDYGLEENDRLEGMTTSQRSESIDKFLKKIFRKKLILHEFVVQYDKVVANRRESKRLVETATKQTKRNLFCAWNVEDEASKLYTRKIFHCF
ncbi:hypothetical protein Ddye_004816 [Dipteronia dyeriana]|uniref:Protein FAR1-RELATED SEQUENCE n=1 Tax=Dipteronia dyeriana TaxID=168575 RepID=A0AAD9XFW6_9ROSI|nr:hypothetical protein Ddye_004816 [Dipteronia dyeriana]